MNQEKVNYIKSLVRPTTSKSQSRKLWSIDLETVLLPFFVATNTQGVTVISPDALGAPIRLGYSKDGAVRFNKNGRPVTTVAKEIRDQTTILRENFVAGLVSFTGEVIKENAEGYKATIALAKKAGDPIIEKDKKNLSDAIALQVAEMVEAAETANAETAKAVEPVAEVPTVAEVVKVEHITEPEPVLAAV